MNCSLRFPSNIFNVHLYQAFVANLFRRIDLPMSKQVLEGYHFGSLALKTPKKRSVGCSTLETQRLEDVHRKKRQVFAKDMSPIVFPKGSVSKMPCYLFELCNPRRRLGIYIYLQQHFGLLRLFHFVSVSSCLRVQGSN